ncbi:hypothetical protein DFA_01747 [Cavenderia fasciculata]|uniref:Pleckstrin domain-containing protein n=1 Tax=Cavenderia fasciculata TaxID=261658 RepID=F4PUJ7_CACFS|nr:uncharacterized protein DFA_01747 [Cavenderia fasciculata]EGG21861.1 hypothetical protein DFA_01747 [Cavenderia fasciculata]|eukprot:XP_004359712.1 hypothetical protein DFA_01747 [Cavenderia fasciculata]
MGKKIKKVKKQRDLMTEEDRIKPDIEGWLTKEGGRIKTWKRRFFILKNNRMTYLRDKGDLYCKGKFDLEPSSSVMVVSPREFCVITSKRSYPILADSPNDAQNWCEAINRVLERIRGNKIIYVPTGTSPSNTPIISTSPGQLQQPPQPQPQPQFSYTPFVNGQPLNQNNQYNTISNNNNNNTNFNQNNQNQYNNNQQNNNNQNNGTTQQTPKKQQVQVGWNFNLPSGVSFLNDQNAQIQIRIINARNLLGSRAGDHLDERDPYVKIRTTGNTKSNQFLAETSVVESSLNPRWDETFIVPIDNVLTDMVIIEVHDHLSKDFLGFVGIDFYAQPSYVMQYISWRQSLPGTSKNGASKLKEIGVLDKKNRLPLSSKSDGPYSKKSVIKDYEIRGGWLKLGKDYLCSIYSNQIAQMNDLTRSTSSTTSTTSNMSETNNNNNRFSQNSDGDIRKIISFAQQIQLSSSNDSVATTASASSASTATATTTATSVVVTECTTGDGASTTKPSSLSLLNKERDE